MTREETKNQEALVGGFDVAFSRAGVVDIDELVPLRSSDVPMLGEFRESEAQLEFEGEQNQPLGETKPS